jgi:hypothetical protein
MQYALTDRYHVIPLGDHREHTDTVDCWCHPTPDEMEPHIFVHHSLDGREDYEQGRLRLH